MFLTPVVDVPVVKSPFEANVLHKLVAKKVISQLVADSKAVNYWDRDRKEEMKKKIVEISVKEQVLSPHTALIGVADEKSVTGVSQRVDVGRHDSELNGGGFSFGGGSRMLGCAAAAPAFASKSAYNAPHLCSVGAPPPPSMNSFGFGTAPPLPSFGLAKSAQSFGAPPPPPPSAPTRGLLRSKKKSGSFFGGITSSVGGLFGSSAKSETKESDSAPKSMFVGQAFNSAPYRESETSMGGLHFDEESSSNASEDDFDLKSAAPIPPKTPISTKKLNKTYQTITNNQDPAGFWQNISNYDFEPEKSKKIFEKFSDELASATVYALVLLLSIFGEQYNEWKLTAIKGVSFLKVNNISVEKFKEIVDSWDGGEIDEDLVDELFE